MERLLSTAGLLGRLVLCLFTLSGLFLLLLVVVESTVWPGFIPHVVTRPRDVAFLFIGGGAGGITLAVGGLLVWAVAVWRRPDLARGRHGLVWGWSAVSLGISVLCLALDLAVWVRQGDNMIALQVAPVVLITVYSWWVVWRLGRTGGNGRLVPPNGLIPPAA